jgi:threonine dehydrogenase-like Zn-dependent dehydrogenase
VAVIGSGAVGLGAVAGAAFRGARVISVDVDACKLRLARKAGAAETINPVEEPLLQRIAELTNDDGPDVVVEAVGLPQTYRSAIEMVAYAGRVVYIGYAREHVEYDTRFFVRKELDILGSRNAATGDFEEVMRMLAAGNFPVEDTISRMCRMDDAETVFSDWNRNPGAFTKIVVDVGNSEARQTEPGHRPVAPRHEVEDNEDQ